MVIGNQFLISSMVLLSSVAMADGMTIDDGVVVDPTSASVFVMRPGGGIEAISIPTGRQLWQTDLADKPLEIRGGRLLAQIETADHGVLPLLIVDAQHGALISEHQLTLPEHVHARIDDGSGIDQITPSVP